jgi:radical SAM superfamily enzyme YgiQ (UPF0313 family)
MNDFTLLIPPYGDDMANGPPLALLEFKKLLHHHGIPFQHKDLNLDFLYKLTDSSFVKKLIKSQESLVTEASRRKSANDFNDEIHELFILESLLNVSQYDRILYLFNKLCLKDSNRMELLEYEKLEDMLSGKFRSHILDEYFDNLFESDQLLAVIESRIVGISINYAQQVYAAIKLAKYIKEHNPTATIILGGTQISLTADTCRKYYFLKNLVDGLVVYDGLKPLLQIIDRVRNSQPISGIPNVITRDTTESFKLGKAMRMRDLPKKVPDPSLVGNYFSDQFVPIYGAKGCYWGKCRFCDFIALYRDTQANIDFRPVEHIVDEMQFYCEAGYRRFHLVAEAIPRKMLEKIADLIINRDLCVDILVMYKIEKVQDPLTNTQFYEKMKRAGVTKLYFGMESVSPKLLKTINKPYSRYDILQTLSAVRNAGIKYHLGLIPDIPGCTLEDAEESCEFMWRHRDLFHALIHSRLYISIHSEFGKNMKRYNMYADHEYNYLRNIYHHRFSHISADEHKRILEIYRSLCKNIADYHHNMGVEHLLENTNFSWDDSAFILKQFSYKDALNHSKTLIFNEDNYALLEMDKKYLEMIQWFNSNVTRTIQYTECIDRFNRIFPKKDLNGVLYTLAENGFLKCIYNCIEKPYNGVTM